MVDLNNKTILCTGGSGFIGSNFIEYVLRNYTNVVIYNFDKRGVGSREIFPGEWGKWGSQIDSLDNGNRYYFYPVNLVNTHHSGYFSDLKFDFIFHFAAESHVDRSINSPSSFVDNNVMGTAKLLDYIKDHQPQARIICISTDEVYGHLGLDEDPFTEQSPLAPRSPYAASKAASDLIALSYHETYGLDVLVTRCCNNYGPWQHSEKFIPTVINKLLKGEKIPVYGNGQNIREWIFVDDHNKSILEICERGISGNVYNIGSGLEYTNLDMVEILVGEVLGSNESNHWKDYVKFVDDRKGHDFRYAIDSKNYYRGFQLTPFGIGIKGTVSHYIRSLLV